MKVVIATGALVYAFGIAASAEPISVPDFIEQARGADIVVLGEIHDNAEHHVNQLSIVRALQPAALVFEMIPQKRETEVNALRAADATRDEIAAALDWANSGWPDFAFYAGIMEAAPGAQIFGGGQPVADVRRAMVEGASGPFGPDAETYGLGQPLEPEEQAARETTQAEAHCDALPADLLPGMVEAQRFRDAGLADAALWARTMSGNGQVVVITGTGHADKREGAPAAIAVAASDVRVLSLGQLEAAPKDAEAFDHYMLAPPPPDRPDPCAALLEPEE